VDGLEALVRELQQQARLPHACKHGTNNRPNRQSPPARVSMVIDGTRAADADPIQSPPRPRGANCRGGQAERGEGIGAAEAADSGGGRGRGGARRTCVADDDVLEEVGIRHPRRIGSDRPVPARRWRCFPGREEKRRRVPEDSTRFDSIRDAVGLGVMKQRRVWDSRAVGWGVGCTWGGRTVQREGSENVTDAEANQDSNSNGASLAGAGWACPNKGARLRG
jgi:hypothetical protein